MSQVRRLLIRVLPGSWVDGYRKRRIDILEAAGGTTSLPASLRVFARRGFLRVVPDPVEYWYRRRRAARRYLAAVGHEIVEQEGPIVDVGIRAAIRQDELLQRVLKDVLERTDLVLQQLDRRIEALSARTEQRVGALEDAVGELRLLLDELRPLTVPPPLSPSQMPASPGQQDAAAGR